MKEKILIIIFGVLTFLVTIITVVSPKSLFVLLVAISNLVFGSFLGMNRAMNIYDEWFNEKGRKSLKDFIKDQK